MGHAISYAFATAVALFLLRGRLRSLDGARIWRTIGKVVPAAALTAGAAWLVATGAGHVVDTATVVGRLVQVGSAVVVGLGVTWPRRSCCTSKRSMKSRARYSGGSAGDGDDEPSTSGPAWSGRQVHDRLAAPAGRHRAGRIRRGVHRDHDVQGVGCGRTSGERWVVEYMQERNLAEACAAAQATSPRPNPI